MGTKDIQKRIYQNKVDKGFDVTNVEKEFCLLHGELAELYEAYRKHLTRVWNFSYNRLRLFTSFRASSCV